MVNRTDDPSFHSSILNRPRIPITPPPAPQDGQIWTLGRSLLKLLSDLWGLISKSIGIITPPFSFINVYDIPGYNHEEQQHQNWCYAAVGASISKFYDPKSPWDQCNIVNELLGRNDCCEPFPYYEISSRNQPGDLASGIPPSKGSLIITKTYWKKFTHVKETTNVPQAYSFEAIWDAVLADEPVAIRHYYNVVGKYVGGHFTVISGANRITGTVTLKDSYRKNQFFVDETIDFKILQTRHGLDGQWTHTYFTKNPKPFI